MKLPAPSTVEARLREASRLSDLSIGRRLEAKLDMSPAAVEARLREAAELLRTCEKLAAFGHAASRNRVR
ncbi:MAG: hypothetical protein IT379_05075 [Deltaproteobacteria bacterium]|nr:hypothetical protein [Deltaproteobacteria bacterium]